MIQNTPAQRNTIFSEQGISDVTNEIKSFVQKIIYSFVPVHFRSLDHMKILKQKSKHIQSNDTKHSGTQNTPAQRNTIFSEQGISEANEFEFLVSNNWLNLWYLFYFIFWQLLEEYLTLDNKIRTHSWIKLSLKFHFQRFIAYNLNLTVSFKACLQED